MKKLLLSACALLTIFAANAQTLPNPGFENWTVTNYQEPNGWWTTNEWTVADFGIANVTKVSPGVSNDALRMETIAQGIDTLIGGITNTFGDPFNAEGGQPFSQKPTTLGGSFKYNIKMGDTGWIYVIFKKNGSAYSVDTIHITGSVSNFVVNNWALPQITASVITPDSVIVVITCSNFDGYPKAGSYLELDNLELKGPGITQNINGKFDNWTPVISTVVNDWDVSGEIDRVSATAYAGTYAIRLTSKDDGTGFVESADISTQITLAQTIDTLSGYYRYDDMGSNDTGSLRVVFLDNSQSFIDIVEYNLPQTSSGWVNFKLPLTTTMGTAASALIMFTSSKNTPGTDMANLLLDSLSIIKQVVSVNDVVGKITFSVYPNPVRDVLNISINGVVNDELKVVIRDMKGAVVFTNSYKQTPSKLVAVPVKDLAAGTYFYEVTANGASSVNKFIKN
jgi:hypothetical protein